MSEQWRYDDPIVVGSVEPDEAPCFCGVPKDTPSPGCVYHQARAADSVPGWRARAQQLEAEVARLQAQVVWPEVGKRFVFTSIMPTVPDDSRPDGRAPDWDRLPDFWISSDGQIVLSEDDVPATGGWTAVWLESSGGR